MSVAHERSRGLLAAAPAPDPGAARPIAYFGASVTVQRRDGYRIPLHAALCKRSGRPHRPVFAGIGGVGSISGLFLLDDLVLRHRPGLCFVEFATTDMVGLTPPGRLRPVLEAIVGRLRAHDCEPCFVLLGRRDLPPAEQDTVLDAYRDVAAAHRIRCVDLAEELGRDEGMFRDVVHTSARGSKQIAARVAAAVDAVDAGAATARPKRWAPSFADVRLIPASPAQLRDPGACETGVLGGIFPYVLARPENAFEVSFEGELTGIAVAIGPTAGGVRVAGGGAEERAVLWDYMCHYERLSTLVLAEPRRAGAPVTVEAVNEEIDYASAHEPVADPTAIVQELRLIGYMVRQ